MTAGRLHEDEEPVDAGLARRLVADQFPEWADQPIERLTSIGTSHAVFRLGAEPVLRLPRIAAAEAQVDRELTWLPVLAPQLSVDLPTPVAAGRPAMGYPFAWLVSRWVPGIDGHVSAGAGAHDEHRLAAELGSFVRSLWRVEVGGQPLPGKRGRALAPHDDVVRSGIRDLVPAGHVDGSTAVAATAVWDRARAADRWSGPPVWVHGDLLASNLVIRDGGLAGVIDWSATGVGDPACDLMASWDWSPTARDRFRDVVAVDEATWTRAQGWIVEQTVAFIPYYALTLPEAAEAARRRLAAVVEAS